MFVFLNPVYTVYIISPSSRIDHYIVPYCQPKFIIWLMNDSEIIIRIAKPSI